MYDQVHAFEVYGKVVRDVWVEDYLKAEDGSCGSRVRLVALEITEDARFDTAEGSALHEAERTGIALFVPLGSDLLLATYDQREEFYHAYVGEPIAEVSPPRRIFQGVCWQLRLGMYGTQWAVLFFQSFVMTTWKEYGFVRRAEARQVFWNVEKELYVVVTNDDFLVTGRRCVQDWFYEVLGQYMMIKRGSMGAEPRFGESTEGELLKMLGCFSSGFTWRRDLIHVDTIVKACFDGATATTGRPSQASKHERKAAKDSARCLLELAKQEFQRLAIQVLYHSEDRLEIQQAVGDILRSMATPARQHW